MSGSWIIVRAYTVVKRKDQTAVSQDDINSIAQQIGSDAVYGSFASFPSDYWDTRWETPPKKLVRAKGTLEDAVTGRMRLELALASHLYPPESGGIQHLIGVLAGDLFHFAMPQFGFEPFRVESVSLPDSATDALCRTYREGRGHSIREIRKSFKLEAYEPLLAFSLKPRIGLTSAAIEDTVPGVLRSGFHIVELDTRNVTVDALGFKNLCEIAKKAAAISRGTRVTRFSPNLTVAAPRALELFRKFQATSDPPYTIKIDGGLDGLSTVQHIRQEVGGVASPIITCYPLLRDFLDSKFPKAAFITVLASSGVDILYPGGRPDVGTGSRKLGAAESGGIVSAVKRYREFEEDGWPMVSLAGGIYAGQLHALYELVGPAAAFFLGGAVALHREGPIKGAELCSGVIKGAIEAAKTARSGNKRKKISALPNSLILQIEEAYELQPGEAPGTYAYLKPQEDVLDKARVPRW